MAKYISYELRSQITQIDPYLDANWQEKLLEIYAQINEETKETLQQRYLKPKNIFWNNDSKQFEVLKQTTLKDLIFQLKQVKTQHLAQKILDSLSTLKSYKDVNKVADYLESVLNQIDKIDVEENLSFQKDKHTLRQTFLYNAAEIIKTLDFVIPDNCRQLTAEEIRTFILEIFIKNEISGYWFKTLLPRQLKKFNHAFLHDYLFTEQKVRNFEVVETSKYIYIIASVQEANQNPYSIRRFLLEEKFGLEEKIYLNGVVIRENLLSNEQYIEYLKWKISRIITVQRQISPQVIELMDNLHKINFEKLLPLFKETLDASGYSFDDVITKRLAEFEKIITVEMLQPFQDALRQYIRHHDEFEYCFMSMHRLIADILSFYKDFSSEPAIYFNTQAKIFEYRLISYLKLLEKRKHIIFTEMDQESFNKHNNESKYAIQKVKEVISTGLKKHTEFQMLLKKKQRELDDLQKAGFFSKIFKKPQKVQEEITQIQIDAQETRRLTYLDVIKTPKQHLETTVYLEFECYIPIDDTERHYAFTNGINGISMLPILVQLPEDKTTFNLQTTLNTLNFDLAKARQQSSTTLDS